MPFFNLECFSRVVFCVQWNRLQKLVYDTMLIGTVFSLYIVNNISDMTAAMQQGP